MLVSDNIYVDLDHLDLVKFVWFLFSQTDKFVNSQKILGPDYYNSCRPTKEK